MDLCAWVVIYYGEDGNWLSGSRYPSIITSAAVGLLPSLVYSSDVYQRVGSSHSNTCGGIPKNMVSR